MEQDKIAQVVREHIILPCAVQPGRKKAYWNNGTVFLQLEKMGEAVASISSSDWSSAPEF
jgi:hypothetical protein